MVVKNTDNIAKILTKELHNVGISKNNLARTSGMSRPTMLNIVQTNGGRIEGYSITNLLRILDVLDLELVIRSK